MQTVNGDCLEVMREMDANSIDALLTDPPAGIGFMGKEWDHHKGGRDQWVAWMTDVMAECYRVLKPGAHGLVWAIPRTSHWTATALENAGFEVRDVVTHLFGSGFPKSLNVSKAIDKAAGTERPVIGKLKAPASTNRVSTMGRPEHSGSGWQDAPDLTAPATEAAKQWDGWGTALKPASEHWILVRKPLSEKTVAANVLKWGTGAINIDGCRISTDWNNDPNIRPNYKNHSHQKGVYGGNSLLESKTEYNENRYQQGRFPANLVLSHTIFCGDECADDCPVRMLDEQSLAGGMHSAGKARHRKRVAGGKGSFGLAGGDGHRIGDTGGASRFFYVAKASKKDRGEGNTHPTVKPRKLMQYLARLITPPGGVILDPFMGSGSTGVAAKGLGYSFIGIEREPEYWAIADQRISSAQSI